MNNLVPCRSNHAVKEASLTVFIDGLIEDFASFESLLDDGLKGVFKRFELVNTQEVKLEVTQVEQKVSKSDIKTIGFKFIEYDDGQPTRVFQGINEVDRTYITFHELNYIRWEQFSELFQKCITVLSKKMDYKVKAYSLHFIDEFNWNSSELIPFDKIFKKDNPIIPKIFYDSKSVDFLLTRNMKKDGKDWSDLIERIQINGIYNNGKDTGSKILVSHNLSETVDNKEEVSELIESEKFKGRVIKVHEINKGLISVLFNEDILKTIKLNG